LHEVKKVLAPRSEAAVETKASHEVMDLVRQNPDLGLLVIQLREAGRPWLVVKAELEAKIDLAKQRRSNGRPTRSG
jgi:hypothetical protein